MNWGWKCWASQMHVNTRVIMNEFTYLFVTRTHKPYEFQRENLNDTMMMLKCCFTSTGTVGLLGTGAQDVHLDFHTAPELCLKGCWLLKCCFTSTETVGLLRTGSQDVHLDFHTAPELCQTLTRALGHDTEAACCTSQSDGNVHF